MQVQNGETWVIGVENDRFVRTTRFGRLPPLAIQVGGSCPRHPMTMQATQDDRQLISGSRHVTLGPNSTRQRPPSPQEALRASPGDEPTHQPTPGASPAQRGRKGGAALGLAQFGRRAKFGRTDPRMATASQGCILALGGQVGGSYVRPNPLVRPNCLSSPESRGDIPWMP